jgi:serine/threonine protein kinase
MSRPLQPPPEDSPSRRNTHLLPTDSYVAPVGPDQADAGGEPNTVTNCATTGVRGGSPSVPGYEVIEELGRGGMGVVYKANQVALKRLVALKMILAGEHAGPSQVARFRVEAEAVAQLHHPNIVQIYEIGEQDGRPYLSLEFVEAGSLGRQLAGQPLPADQAARLVATLAHAIDAAHRQGIIHRDLKPANILLTVDGTPKIADFGLAKRFDQATLGPDGGGLTRTGAILGTPSYMAPEQAAGNKQVIGPAIDVYALGAILYELLTGRPPFRADAPWETIRQVLSDEPVPPHRLQTGVPRDLETVCLKCLRKEPGQRYVTAELLANDLERFLVGEPIRARRTRFGERLRYWARQRRAVLIGGVTAVCLCLLVGALVFHFARRGNTPPTESEGEVGEKIKALMPEAAAARLEELDLLGEGGRVPKFEDFDNQSLTMRLLALRPEENSDLNVMDGVNVMDLVAMLVKSKKKGYVSCIQPEFITSFNCHVQSDVATGYVWFEAKGFYKGRLQYSARRLEGQWCVVQFRLPIRRLRLDRQPDGKWKQSGLNVK